MKAHRCGASRNWKPPPRTGSQVEQTIWRAKRKAKLKEAAESVQIEGQNIEWVWDFLYLGHRFEADADSTQQDMKERFGKATGVFSVSGMMRVLSPVEQAHAGPRRACYRAQAQRSHRCGEKAHTKSCVARKCACCPTLQRK
jgi:hypothetical protein